MDYLEIEQPKELADLNRRLSAKLERILSHKETRTIGSPGGSFPAKVYFRSARGNNVFWWSGRPSRDKSAVTNLFGHGTPGGHDPLNIDVQFNLPVVRFSRRRGGAFLRELRSNKIILVHRGIVTLRRSRIRKDVLFEKMDITLLEAETSRGSDEFLPIEELGAPELIENIDRFSRQLRQIVQSINAKATENEGYRCAPQKPRRFVKCINAGSNSRNFLPFVAKACSVLCEAELPCLDFKSPGDATSASSLSSGNCCETDCSS